MIKRTLYFGNPAYLSTKYAQLEIRLPEVEKNSTLPESFKASAVKQVPIEDIGVVVLDNKQITITQGALGELLGNNVAVVTCDEHRMPTGLMLPLAGNTTQSEELEWYKSSLHSNYLPEMMAGFTFDKTSFSEEKGLTVDGDVIFMGDIEESGGTAFTDLKLVYIINDKIVDEQEIPETVFESAFSDIDVQKTYPDAKEGDTFTLYIDGVDEYGFVHRITLKETVCSSAESDAEEPSDGFYEIILDKDGNELCS